MSPGYTVSPEPSTMRASPGALTVAPTAVMMPSRITIVPFSMAGDETGTMRAFVMAYVCGMLRGETSCAASGAAVIATAIAAATPRRNEDFIAIDLLGGVARMAWRWLSREGHDHELRGARMGRSDSPVRAGRIWFAGIAVVR